MADTAKRWQQFCERAVKLHRLLGSKNPGERQNAWDALDKLLEQHSKTWNDLPELLRLGNTFLSQKTSQPKDDEPEPIEPSEIPNAFDLVYYTLRHYIHVKTEHELVGLALWAMHTFVFDQFAITPRLAILSPVRGCGKTIVLTALNRLTCRAERHDDPSEAVLYHAIDFRRPTLLIDEIDNQDRLSRPGLMRSIFNSGHHADGSVSRLIHGQPRRFSTFCPLALAGIGSLPLPLLQRCIVLQMQRAPRGAKLKRLDTKNKDQMQDFDNIHWLMSEWSRYVVLDLNPQIPKELHNRRADNWRVLLAVADACDRGDMARAAAVALSRQHQDEDLVVELLEDVRTVFNERHVDRIASGDLCAALRDLEDRPWSEWRGLQDNRPPRPLSQGDLSGMLRPFGISPKSVWPAAPRVGAKSRKGYMRTQFESAWAAYVDLQEPDEDEAQPSSSKKPPLRLV
jgi:hypothetical protein